METELGLNGSMDHTDLFVKDHLIKFLDHLPRAELTQITSLLARGTRGVLRREARKLSSGLNFGLQVQALGLRVDEYVACIGCGHCPLLSLKGLAIAAW